MKTLFSLQLNRIDKIFLLIMGVLLIIGVFTLILMIANRGHGKVILKRHIKKTPFPPFNKTKKTNQFSI